MPIRSKVTIAAVAVTTLLALAGCSAGNGASSSDGKHSSTLTINGAQPISFDPAQGQEGTWLPTFQAVYDTLILRKPNGSISPMLATSWTYNEERTALTLELRHGVTFSDGASFNAEAAKANLDHFRTGSGPQGGTLADVTSVDVLSKYSVRINLSQTSPSLLFSLANAAGLMGSPHALGTKEIKTNPVGSGPYTLDTADTVSGSSYTFVKREGYWNPSLQHYDKVVIKVIADGTATLNALLSGQLDAGLLNSKTAVQARTDDNLTEYKYVNNWLGLILYDRAGSVIPAMADVRVRQAISYAIDSKSILKSIYSNHGTQTTQIFNPSATAYEPSLDGAYPFNPSTAKKLMAEAGYSQGFTMTLPVAASLDPAMIAAVVDQLSAIGITVKTQAADPADLIGDLTSKKYAAIPITLFMPDTSTTIANAVVPKALFNAQGTTNATVDGYIATIRTGSDADAKVAAQALNKYLVDEAWFVPFFRVDQAFFAKKGVSVTPQQEQSVPSIYNYQPAS